MSLRPPQGPRLGSLHMAWRGDLAPITSGPCLCRPAQDERPPQSARGEAFQTALRSWQVLGRSKVLALSGPVSAKARPCGLHAGDDPTLRLAGPPCHSDEAQSREATCSSHPVRAGSTCDPAPPAHLTCRRLVKEALGISPAGKWWLMSRPGEGLAWRAPLLSLVGKSVLRPQSCFIRKGGAASEGLRGPPHSGCPWGPRNPVCEWVRQVTSPATHMVCLPTLWVCVIDTGKISLFTPSDVFFQFKKVLRGNCFLFY